jgi:hypothetical protein
LLKEEPRKVPEKRATLKSIAPRLIMRGESANIESKSWPRLNEKTQKSEENSSG